MKLRRITALLLCVLMLLPLASCFGPEDPDEEDPASGDGIAYKVTVVDALGAPIPDLIVSIYLDGELVAQKLTRADGSVEAKEPLESGKYTVKVFDPASNDAQGLLIDESLAVLEEGKEEITVVVYQAADELYADNIYLAHSASDTPIKAPVLTGGGYMVDLKEGKNYFVFIPDARGLYTVSVSSSASVGIGYHGMPQFVQDNNLASNDKDDEVYMSEGSLCLKVRSFNVGMEGGSTRYVVMVESDAAAKGIITFGYTSELPVNDAELPWSDYILPNDPEKYTVEGKSEEGFALTDVDITDENLTIVYNSATDSYHVGSIDGPVLLVKMTVASKYLAAFSTMMETVPFRAYVYDEAGALVAKRNYHSMMTKYCEAADEDLGVVELNSHIVNALTNFGKVNRWFDVAGDATIYGEDALSVRPELIVYQACCYIAD